MEYNHKLNLIYQPFLFLIIVQLLLEPTTKPMELASFFTFWLQDTTFLLRYGKYIYMQSCIFRTKIDKTT
jgi:hypothetical protein